MTDTTPPRRRPWRLIALLVVVLVGVPTAYAVAAPATDNLASQTCKSLYDPASSAYTDCMALATDTAAGSSVPGGSAPPKKIEVNTIEGTTPDTPTRSNSGDDATAPDPAPSPPPSTAPTPPMTTASPATTPAPTPIPTMTAPTTAPPTPTATPSPPPPTPTAHDPLSQAIDRARRPDLNLRIWLDADLTTIWQNGPDQLKATVDRLAQQAAKPGVAGVKIAYDLGLRNFTSTKQIQRFVTETSGALRAALPAGRQIAIDVPAPPELGCGTSQPCQQALRTKYPLLTLAHVESYVLTGAVDVVNVSSGLFSSDYKQWKIPLERALTQQWLRLRARGWDTRVHLGAREIGLAHRDATSKVSKAAAEAAVTARVDQPLRTGGVRSVVLWTHRQTWDGATWRLTDTGLNPNNVWNALIRRKALGRIAITYNPHEPEKTIDEDLQVLSQVATEVYLHAQ
ncbi:hypothetical protein ACFV1N_20600 [Streptosporangium canum]|uniref:hypothetical protein n=1 Tax=Streptosporangium canum TaxID=324952 RepID=UPI0036BA09AD